MTATLVHTQIEFSQLTAEKPTISPQYIPHHFLGKVSSRDGGWLNVYSLSWSRHYVLMWLLNEDGKLREERFLFMVPHLRLEDRRELGC